MSDEKPEKLSKYWVREVPGPIQTKGIRDWVEEQIQEAMDTGKFDKLPGTGAPLDLGWEHPWEERNWMTNHILSNAKVVPEWVNMEREIRADIEWLRANPEHPDRAERVAALNRRIDRFNLHVPAGFMQMARYRDDAQSR